MNKNNTQECKCLIGVQYDYENTDAITLAELKEYIEREKQLVEYHKDSVNSEWWKAMCNSFTLADYCDRRKHTNLKRFNYCPRCGKKIDWKAIRDGAEE